MWYNTSQENIAKEGEATWRQNADTAVQQVTDADARTVRTGFTSTATTRSIANGAARRATDTDARMVQTDCIDTARAATSASGAVRRPTARVAPTPRRAATRSDEAVAR